MRKNHRPVARYGLALAALGFSIGFLGSPLFAEDDGLPLTFDATAMNISNVGPRGTARLQITVDRWSTEEERADLLAALKDPARRSLPNALFSQEPVGRVREAQSTAEILRYARVVPQLTGQQIILATDRPLGFMEVSRGLRTQDYNVTLIVLDVDGEGNGEGQLMMGAELSFDDEKNQIVIEHFATQPVRLTTVRLR